MDVHEGIEQSGPLPEEMLEVIVTMLPFPEIFKVRLLSKSWLARFQPVSSLNGVEEKRLAAGFQKQLRERSRNWGSFYPVCVREDVLFGYNRGSKTWQRLPSPCFLRQNLMGAGLRPKPSQYIECHENLQVDGVFVYGSLESPLKPRHLFVGNLVTRKWRKLPPRPVLEVATSFVKCIKLVSDASLEAYKLILSCQGIRKDLCHFAQIYDSKSRTWSRKNFVNTSGRELSPSTFAYLNGVLYGISIRRWRENGSFYLRSVAAFNVEEGTMEERIMPSTLHRHITKLFETRLFFPVERQAEVGRLMVCNGKLILILNGFVNRPITVFEIDVKSLQWREVARCDLHNLEADIIDIPVNEDNSTFFQLSYPDLDDDEDPFHGTLVVYDKHEDQWRFFRFAEDNNYLRSNSSFEPGLNPFMEV